MFSKSEVRALVTTGDHSGKFYSNGMDVNWVAYHSQSEEGQTYLKDHLLPSVRDFSCRLLTFPLPTIAAINGE